MVDELTVGSLFAGIGGFDLGFERAGMRTVWFCEQDKFCQRVLAKHWPGVPCYDDVCLLNAGNVEPVDVLCGGFPCQDLSVAGKGAGLDGARSGLWSEYARLVGELRPKYVVVENVSALLARGLGRVLGDLAAVGYDAEWDCIPASAFGAPHRRDRIWLIAYPNSDAAGRCGLAGRDGAEVQRSPVCEGGHPNGLPHHQRRYGAASYSAAAGAVADPEREGLQGVTGRRVAGTRGPSVVAAGGGGGFGSEWSPEPAVGRVADGFPGRVDQVRALGNALVPQVAEWIGRRIVEWERLNADR